MISRHSTAANDSLAIEAQVDDSTTQGYTITVKRNSITKLISEAARSWLLKHLEYGDCLEYKNCPKLIQQDIVVASATIRGLIGIINRYDELINPKDESDYVGVLYLLLSQAPEAFYAETEHLRAALVPIQKICEKTKCKLFHMN